MCAEELKKREKPKLKVPRFLSSLKKDEGEEREKRGARNRIYLAAVDLEMRDSVSPPDDSPFLCLSPFPLLSRPL